MPKSGQDRTASVGHPSFRLTLDGVFFATIAAITLLVGGLFVVFWQVSRGSMLDSAEAARRATAMQVERDVHSGLAQADRALRNVELALRTGLADASAVRSVEELLASQLIENEQLYGATFTHAEKLGVDLVGQMTLAPANRWQVSVRRRPGDDESVVETRTVSLAGDGFVAMAGESPVGFGSFGASLRALGPVPDPTEGRMFRDAVAGPNYGHVSKSDLHYSEPDPEDATAGPRVVVTAHLAVTDRAGKFVGVVGVSLLADTVDKATQPRSNQRDPHDPTRVFLCDDHGRLVTRPSPDDPFVPVDDTLRVRPSKVPQAVAAALESPELRGAALVQTDRSFSLKVGGERFLVTLHRVAESHGWMVGIVVPEDFYVHDLRVLRDRFLVAYSIVTALILVGGFGTLRTVRRGLGRVLEATASIRRFDFSPSPSTTPFGDIQEVIDSLERAKTVARALGKYVPLGLVRTLYESNHDPELGGTLRELTVLFSDIKGFTEIAERLSPDKLARALGAYFDRMAHAIAATHGVVDKYIGDSIMAMWNAPGFCPDHPAAACRAVLGCIEALRALYASNEWLGLPPLVTRFGLHVDTVFVGHFGATSRFSYTALGDGVNLASRLEGLCKQYGVVALVSDAVERQAADAFVFRLVDRVIVKGRSRPVAVYELLGMRSDSIEGLDRFRAYERAFEAYTRRDFAEALRLLPSIDDGPSRVLAERCKRYITDPPPTDWDGVFRAESK